METIPAAAAADRATRNCFKFSIVISVNNTTAATERSDLTGAAVFTTKLQVVAIERVLGHMTQSCDYVEEARCASFFF